MDENCRKAENQFFVILGIAFLTFLVMAGNLVLILME